MIFLSEDAVKYIKRSYIKSCIVTCMCFALMYTISKKVKEQDEKINDLTKKNKELKTKGD